MDGHRRFYRRRGRRRLSNRLGDHGSLRRRRRRGRLDRRSGIFTCGIEKAFRGHIGGGRWRRRSGGGRSLLERRKDRRFLNHTRKRGLTNPKRHGRRSASRNRRSGFRDSRGRLDRQFQRRHFRDGEERLRRSETCRSSRFGRRRRRCRLYRYFHCRRRGSRRRIERRPFPGGRRGGNRGRLCGGRPGRNGHRRNNRWRRLHSKNRGGLFDREGRCFGFRTGLHRFSGDRGRLDRRLHGFFDSRRWLKRCRRGRTPCVRPGCLQRNGGRRRRNGHGNVRLRLQWIEGRYLLVASAFDRGRGSGRLCGITPGVHAQNQRNAAPPDPEAVGKHFDLKIVVARCRIGRWRQGKAQGTARADSGPGLEHRPNPKIPTLSRQAVYIQVKTGNICAFIFKTELQYGLTTRWNRQDIASPRVSGIKLTFRLLLYIIQHNPPGNVRSEPTLAGLRTLYALPLQAETRSYPYQFGSNRSLPFSTQILPC